VVIGRGCNAGMEVPMNTFTEAQEKWSFKQVAEHLRKYPHVCFTNFEGEE